MAQFDRGKFNQDSGILSYNYLGGEGGKGGGGVFIKQFKGKWHFVNKDGEIRKDVGIKGKLTPTHIQNLKNDNIFAAANIDSKGEILSEKTEIVSKSVQPDLAESNYSLPEMSLDATPSRVKDDFKTIGDPNAKRSGPITASTENAPPILQSGWGGETARFNKKMIGSGYSENTPYIPDNVVVNTTPQQTMTSSPFNDVAPATYTGPGTSNWSSGTGELSVRGTSTQGNMPMNYSSGGDWSQSSPSGTPTPTEYDNSGYTFPTGEGTGQMSLRADRNRDPGDFESVGGVPELAGQNEFTGFGQDRMSGPSYGVTPSYQRSFSSGLDTKGLDIGTGGEDSMWDSDYYMKDGQLMKDSGVFGEDTIATQSDIDLGIKDQNASPWGSTAGWEAAGSVMKGVGGLASAYTGIKSYQLARDAHNTQKNQWQANYKQRLDAYQDNKDLANEEIRRKNRTLVARGQKASYKELA